MNVAVILAGGAGTRVGAEVPKQFIEILGKPVLAYTLDNFQNHPRIDAIEIVYHKDYLDEIKGIVAKYGYDKVRWYAEGGDSFQASTISGFFHLRDKLSPEDMVVLSFGVSPMTTAEIIDDSLRVCEKHGNAIAAEPMALCTCIMDDEFSSTQSILRETLRGFSNPWTFRFGEVCAVYEEAARQGILDTVEPHTTSVYFALGKRIYFSKTNTLNFKITTREDLDLFEGLLLLKQKRMERNNL